jgi:endonuclease/exonuclease/phosphatase family metal-dependent hydrolase
VVRVVSFNILHGHSLHDDRVDVDRFAAAIGELDADILALQEVDCDQPRSANTDLTAVAAEAMGAVDSRFVAALSGTPGLTWMAATGDEQPGSAAYGIALLSRYPVRSWQTLRLPRVSFRIPTYLPGPRKFAVVREEPRVAMAALIETPLGAVTVANTHLSFVPGLNVLQLRRLRRDLAALSGPVLLAGDLNLTGPHPGRITGYRALCHQSTFPIDAPTQQLDHLLANRHFGDQAVCSTRRLPISDHRALIADFP